MRKWLGRLWVLGCVGCTQPTPANIARLQGANDLIQAGDLIFVTSSDHDELRVLDTQIAPNQTVRDFIRAPNPLAALSIPVLDFPNELAADVAYDVNGDTVGGPYVYVRGDGISAISIVPTTDRENLKEIRRVFTAAPVTALAARAPLSASQSSRLYFATFDGTRGVVWELSVPLGALPDTLTTREVVSLPGSSVRSIVVLAADSEVALAVLPTASQPMSAFVIDTETGAVRPLNFPVPPRRLFTHPATHGAGADALAASERIFGLLDIETCFNAPFQVPNCPGFTVVSSITGNEVLDLAGEHMILDTGGGIPQRLALSANTHLNGVAGLDNTTVFPLVGTFTTSGGRPQPQGGGAPEPAGGQIYFFDAIHLRHFDTVGLAPTATIILQSNTGDTQPNPTGPGPITTRKGALFDETVTFTKEGKVSGLVDLPRSAGADTNLFLPFAGRAFAGDVAVLGPAANPCSGDLPIAITGLFTAQLLLPVPPDCEGETLFSIRATAPGLSYVVEGNVAGYVGRTGPGQHLAYRRPYFFHPDDYIAQSPVLPAWEVEMNPTDTEAGRDYQYQVTFTSGYRPHFVYPDPAVFLVNGTSTYYLPTAVTVYSGISRAFAAYPSAPSVMEVDLLNVLPGVANGTLSFIEHR